MGTGAGGTLSERPDVRVRAAAVNMFFVRAAEGRVAGRLFLGAPLLWAAKKGCEKNPINMDSGRSLSRYSGAGVTGGPWTRFAGQPYGF